MLVSRENSGDCRSEPDSTMQLAGGSQDRLAVPAMVAPIPSSSVTVSGAVTGATPIGSPAPTTGDSSPTDPAVRRRRLSNLYKVILTFCFFFVCCFLIFFYRSLPSCYYFLIVDSIACFLSSCYSLRRFFLLTLVSLFVFFISDSLLDNRSRVPSTSASVSTVSKSRGRRNLLPLQKEPA